MEDNQSQRYRKAGARSHLSEEEVGFWSEAENGGRDGWFVGRPLMMEEADVCFRCFFCSSLCQGEYSVWYKANLAWVLGAFDPIESIWVYDFTIFDHLGSVGTCWTVRSYLGSWVVNADVCLGGNTTKNSSITQ